MDKMKKVLQNIRQMHNHRYQLSYCITKVGYTKDSNTNATSEETIRSILKNTFPTAKTIEVNDVSGGCGEMYDILVETPDFKGLSIIKQHRAVYDALKEPIKQMHGLHLVTKVPT